MYYFMAICWMTLVSNNNFLLYHCHMNDKRILEEDSFSNITS